MIILLLFFITLLLLSSMLSLSSLSLFLCSLCYYYYYCCSIYQGLVAEPMTCGKTLVIRILFTVRLLEEPRKFSKALWSYHWALVTFVIIIIVVVVIIIIIIIIIIIFIILCVNKFLLITVNSNFYNLSLLRLFWHSEAVPQRCSPGVGCSVGVLEMFRGAQYVGVISIKVAKQLSWNRTSA